MEIIAMSLLSVLLLLTQQISLVALLTVETLCWQPIVVPTPACSV